MISRPKLLRVKQDVYGYAGESFSKLGTLWDPRALGMHGDDKVLRDDEVPIQDSAGII